MTYSQLREEIRKLTGSGFAADTDDIMTAIDIYLEEKAVKCEDVQFSANAGYINGRKAAAQIIRSKE